MDTQTKSGGAGGPYSPAVLLAEVRQGGHLMRKSQIERLSRLAGYAINAHNGTCPLVEEVLCLMTTLCVELLNQFDEEET